MSFEKPRSVTLRKQQLSRKKTSQQISASRYSQCRVMKDGDIKRLTFRRYVPFEAAYDQGRRGEVPPERQHRPDLIAHKLYNNPKMYWVISMFNRGITLNPLRMEVGSVVVLPFPSLVQKWMIKKVF